MFEDDQTARSKYWTAPEILRKQSQAVDHAAKKMADIYSLGIIFSEILIMENPYESLVKDPEGT